MGPGPAASNNSTFVAGDSPTSIRTDFVTTSDSITVRPEPNFFCLLGPEGYLLLIKQFLCFVNPPFALFGMAVNGLSMAILTRSGLHKPANVLLFALTLADTMNMFVNINFPLILLYFGPVKTKPGYCLWEYGQDFNLFLFTTLQAFSFISLWGRLVNGTIPTVITMERILAVYFPVTFKKLVTTKSIVGVCLLCYTIGLPYVIFSAFLRRMGSFQLANGKLVASSTATDLFRQNLDLLTNFVGLGLESLASWLPSSFICVGCVLIGIKVKMSMHRRRKMSKLKEKQRWSPRTTRTLLTTCLIFSFSHVLSTVVSLVSSVDLKSYLLTFFLVQVSQFINTLQCSSNFFVYVLSNRNFWQVFLDMFGLQNEKKKNRE